MKRSRGGFRTQAGLPANGAPSNAPSRVEAGRFRRQSQVARPCGVRPSTVGDPDRPIRSRWPRSLNATLGVRRRSMDLQIVSLPRRSDPPGPKGPTQAFSSLQCGKSSTRPRHVLPIATRTSRESTPRRPSARAPSSSQAPQPDIPRRGRRQVRPRSPPAPAPLRRHAQALGGEREAFRVGLAASDSGGGDHRGRQRQVGRTIRTAASAGRADMTDAQASRGRAASSSQRRQPPQFHRFPSTQPCRSPQLPPPTAPRRRAAECRA